MTVYELNKAYRTLNELFAKIEEAEREGEDVTEVKDQIAKEFEIADGLLEDKIENIARLLKNLDIEAKALKAEEEKLKKKRTSRENQINFIKEKLIKSAMEISGKEKIEAGIFKVSLRKSKSLEIIFEDKIPEKYKEVRQTIYISKPDIKKALDNGEEIEGVILKENKSVQVR